MHPFDWLARIILPLAAAAAAGAMLLVGVTNEPNDLALGFAPLQPIAFSHKQHAGDNKIACLYCHTAPHKSRYAGVPSVNVCMNCHRLTKSGTDQIRQLAKIYEEDQAMPWKRVHRMPDHVYFDHRPHVNAGIDCAACHGDLREMEVAAQRKPLGMGDCLSCHRNPSAYVGDPALKTLKHGPEYCSACHR